MLELTEARIEAGEERFEFPAAIGFSRAASSLMPSSVNLGQEFRTAYPDPETVMPDVGSATYACVELTRYVTSRDLLAIFSEIVTITPEEALVRAAQVIDLQLPNRDRLTRYRYWFITSRFLVSVWDMRPLTAKPFVDVVPRDRLMPLAPGEHILVPANRLPSNDR